LTNNTAFNGGGTCSNNLYNCLLLINVATNNGGGAFYANLTGCNLIGNQATNYGGGSFCSNLTNCNVASNSANYCGGAVLGTGVDCLFSYNAASSIAGGVGGALSNTLYHCVLYSNYWGASYASTLSRCLLTNNNDEVAVSSYDTLDNCVIRNNLTAGAFFDSLNNCTVVNNGSFSSRVNGVYDCQATNCIIYYNYGAGNYAPGPGYSMNNCCTTPLPPGIGNFTNAPFFLDAGLHLASNSPCIGAGNISAAGSVDFDGRPRIVGGAVDVGAMEFQGVDVEPFVAWLAQYGLPDDGSADNADSDGTGMSNWQKWIAGLNPTNPLSVLAMSSVAFTNGATGVTVSWQSVTNVTYYLMRSSDLRSFTAIQSNLVGQAGITRFIDPTATNGGAFFYRVGVQ